MLSRDSLATRFAEDVRHECQSFSVLAGGNMIWWHANRDLGRHTERLGKVCRKTLSSAQSSCTPELLKKHLHLIWKAANGGAKRIVRFFFGGKTYRGECPPKPVLEGSESGIGLVCARSL